MGASASKIKFRESLTALTTRDVSASDAEFWDELSQIPSSSEEVFELLTPGAARRLRDDRFDNLATLFTQATAQLCQIVETPYTIYFDQALNCVRVLTRSPPWEVAASITKARVSPEISRAGEKRVSPLKIPLPWASPAGL